jgi:hypothetical protein
MGKWQPKKQECKKIGTRRKPGYLESDHRLSVYWRPLLAPGRGLLDLRRKLEQQVLRSASPMGSLNCGGSSAVTPPIIESISAVIAHSRSW